MLKLLNASVWNHKINVYIIDSQVVRSTSEIVIPFGKIDFVKACLVV